MEYDRHYHLTLVQWSDTLRQMLGFVSEADFPNTFEAWSSRLHPEDKAFSIHEYVLTVSDRSGKRVFDVEYRLQAKNGEYHWFHAAGGLSRRMDGSPKSFDGVFINTDEKHAKDQQLHQLLRTAQVARKKAELNSEIISAVSRLYDSIYQIDLTKNLYQEISSGSGEHHLTGHKGSAQEKLWEICKEYMIRLAKERKLPFIPYHLGKWWGSNPVIKAQDDVDLLAIDRSGRKAIFVECKFTSHPMPYDEYEDLMTATKAFPNMEEKHLWFFSKLGYTRSVIEQARKDHAMLLTIDDLFD